MGLQHLAEQLGIAPSVQQDVMMGVDQVMLTFGSLHQQQPQQWRTLQFETAFALGRSQREQRGVPIRRLAQVLFGEGQLALSIDDLQGLLQLPCQAKPLRRIACRSRADCQAARKRGISRPDTSTRI